MDSDLENILLGTNLYDMRDRSHMKIKTEVRSVVDIFTCVLFYPYDASIRVRGNKLDIWNILDGKSYKNHPNCQHGRFPRFPRRGGM